MGNARWPAAARDSDPRALTLLDAYLRPFAGGDGLFVPAIRVPLANVHAWWIAGGDVAESK